MDMTRIFLFIYLYIYFVIEQIKTYSNSNNDKKQTNKHAQESNDWIGVYWHGSISDPLLTTQ